jgi:hypothetical protein
MITASLLPIITKVYKKDEKKRKKKQASLQAVHPLEE